MIPLAHQLARWDGRPVAQLSELCVGRSNQIQTAKKTTRWATHHAHADVGMRPAQHVQARAFSLLELIVVLVLMGIAVGLVAPAVARSAGAGREQRAMGDLATTLAAARLDAIRSGRDVEIELLQSESALVIRREDESRVMTDWPLVMIDDDERDIESRALRIDIRGRTAADRLAFRSRETTSRIWAIAFDPVGGVPTAQRLTEATDQ